MNDDRTKSDKRRKSVYFWKTENTRESKIHQHREMNQWDASIMANYVWGFNAGSFKAAFFTVFIFYLFFFPFYIVEW